MIDIVPTATLWAEAKRTSGRPGDQPLRHELRAIERSLSAVCVRLDAAGAPDAALDGVTAMALDQASQAAHLALLEIRACLSAA